MGENSGRLKTVAISVAMLVVIGAAGTYIASAHGTSRAITVLVAVALVAALVWLVLTVVSIVAASSARRDMSNTDTTLRNEQRPVPKRAPILPEDKRSTGHRRRNPDA